MTVLTVERDIWIAAPPERVWQAITQGEMLERWWGDQWRIPELRVGAAIQFGHEGDWMTAMITTVDPPRQFALEWPPQAGYHSIAMTTAFSLTAEQGGTRLHVRETGFEALPDDIRQTRFDQTTKGYETVLASLKHLLEAA